MANKKAGPVKGMRRITVIVIWVCFFHHIYGQSPDDKILLNKAKTVDGTSPGLVLKGAATYDFLYDEEYINPYGFGFHGFGDGGSRFANPVNSYISGYSGVALFTAGSLRLRINQNGNTGIGKRTPTAKLHVDGNIIAEEIKVENVTGADFVFAKDYNLMPLTQIEAYIKANHHLPEVPSATEMEANGVELGKMNMLLLQKIEELTLHAIAQEERIKKLGELVKKND